MQSRGPGRDVKPFKGGPVRCSYLPVDRGHLANVGLEAPRRFSGYSLISLISGDPHTPGH